MILSRIVSLGLRIAEFISAAIVLGLLAYEIHWQRRADVYSGRSIYTLIVSILGILAALALLIPATATFNWIVDLLFSALFFAAFGLLVNANDTASCGGTFDWSRVGRDWCGRARAAQAFTFLAAVFWFASFLLSLWVRRKASRDVQAAHGAPKRRWGRRSAV